MAYNRLKIRNFPYSLYQTGTKTISVTANDAFNFDYNTDFSVIGWINPSITSGMIIKRRSSGKGWNCQVGSGYGGYIIDFFTNNGSNVNFQSTVPHRGWTCVSCVNRSAVREIWGNGVLERSGAFAATSFASPGESMYAHQMVAALPFRGGPIRIYGRALTTQEIQDYYYLGIEPARTNLLLEYDFTEGSGTTITDTSGNGYNGTHSGSPVWDSTNVPMKIRGQALGRIQATGRVQIT